MLGPVDGYGAIGPNHFGSISASRSVLIHATGRNPQHLEAAHSCGNKWCVNLAHLRWATVAENHSDKIGHGTTLRGERNHQTKLSDAQVAEIRAMCAAGGRGTQRQAAAMFGIGEAQVSRIVNRVQRR
jgi:hypothetical protein